MSLIRHALVSLILALLAWPALGYIVFLKDGSQVQTRDKYRLEGEKAYLTLPSGTITVLDAAEIDIPKTEEVNQVDYGTATLIEGGKKQRLAKDVRFEVESRETLTDLARNRRELASSSPRTDSSEQAEVESTIEFQRTLAGFVDLAAMPRREYENEDVRLEIVRYLTGQGVDKVTVHAGLESTHPFLKIIVNSEATVFQALEETAKLLVQLIDRFPQEVEAIDLYMKTSDERPAGQFILTPEKAELLTSGRVSPENFFLRHVEF